MKIAMISTPFETTPPERYGGTERVVSLLTEELVNRGHDVTLFATRNSKTKAKPVSFFDAPHRPYEDSVALLNHVRSLEFIYALEGTSDCFEIIHNHNWQFACMGTLSRVPTVTTLHNDNSDYFALNAFKTARGVNLVTISDSQKFYIESFGLEKVHRIYNGIKTARFAFEKEQGTYLAFLGEITPHKGPHIAIKAAKQTGIPLVLGGKISANMEYYEKEIKPHVDGTFIRFIGELNDAEKTALLGGAAATLFPISWNEPFGLVIVESMACGTPVIAFNKGSVPELIRHGKTGFIVEDLEGMVEAVKKCRSLKREKCRALVEKNFDVRGMADGYEKLYRELVGSRTSV